METMQLILTRGKTALVDAADYALVGHMSWHACCSKSGRTWYAYTSIRNPVTGKYRDQTLHRFLLNPPKGVEVDHINGDGLDNRRVNMRLSTRLENGANQQLSLRNTSGYKGVLIDRGRWAARIVRAGVMKNLGWFDTKEAAAYAYDLAARDTFGEFARFNLLTAESDIDAIRELVKSQKKVLGKALRGRTFARPTVAKLTIPQVKEIRLLYAVGVIQAELARRFHVDRMTIKSILIRETWKHVE